MKKAKNKIYTVRSFIITINYKRTVQAEIILMIRYRSWWSRRKEKELQSKDYRSQYIQELLEFSAK